MPIRAIMTRSRTKYVNARYGTYNIASTRMSIVRSGVFHEPLDEVRDDKRV